MSNLHKLNYKVILIPIKLPDGSFVERLILQFIYKCKGPIIAKTILKKMNKIERLTLSRFVTY